MECTERMGFGKILRYAVLLVLVALAAQAAGADQTLTLALDPPEVSSTTPLSGQAKAEEPPAVSSEPEVTSVGRVGIVEASSAAIYRSRSSSARRYSTVKAETPLAIVKEEGDWYGVLMINGATGWIPRKAVKITGYELVAKKPTFSRGSLVSRGGDPGRARTLGEALAQTAMKYEGEVRYRFGGVNPSTGIDCSAFVRMVFQQYGVSLPRTAREQALVGTTVPFDELQPGDRLYFSCKNPYVDHCGIYAGGGYFVHCNASGGGVTVSPLSNDFYWRSLVVAKRS
jgi:cell wall-associated NlpC family hydrolase